MAGEIPKSFEEQLAGMTLDQLDDRELEIEAELRQEEQELLDFDTKIADAEGQVQVILQEIIESKEKIRIIEEAEAAAGTGPTGVPPSAADAEEEALRQALAAAAAHAGEADPGAASTDPARPVQDYVWGDPNEPTEDPRSWKKLKWAFENTFGIIYDKCLGVGSKDSWKGTKKFIQEHTWAKAALTLVVKVPAKVFGAAIFITTPAQYFFEKGMVKEEQEEMTKQIEAVQAAMKVALDKETPTTPQDEALIAEKIHTMEGAIDHLIYVPAEWKDALKERLALLVNDYRKNGKGESERYGKESARIFNEYIVTKITREEIFADAFSAGAIGLNYLVARGISSAGFGVAGRYAKDNHTFERTHWKEKRLIETREQADEYEAERAKEAALDKILKKGGYEWLDNQFAGGSLTKVGNILWGEGSHGNPFSKEFWNEDRLKLIQGTSMTLRGLGVLAAAAHMSELNAATENHFATLWHSLRDNGLKGGLTTVYENYWHNWDKVWDNAERLRAMAGRGWDWVWSGPSHEPIAPVAIAPVHHEPPPPAAPQPFDHIDAPPKVLFTMRSIHNLRDLGYVNKSSETFVNDRVRMYEVDGVRFETRVVEQLDSHGDRVKLPQIISINNRNVEAIDITSEKQFYKTLNDPDQYYEPKDSPVKNVKFNYWIEKTHDNEFHRFWQRDGIDYEIKGTSVYQDIKTKEFYALPPGHTVHNKYDELQNVMEYKVVGVRMDGAYHVVDVPINDPIGGPADPNAAFTKFHKSVESGKINLSAIDDVPRPAPPTGETPPFDPKTIGRPDPVVVVPKKIDPPVATSVKPPAPIEKVVTPAPAVVPVPIKEPVPTTPSATRVEQTTATTVEQPSVAGSTPTTSVAAAEVATPATLVEPAKPTEISTPAAVVETTPAVPPVEKPAPVIFPEQNKTPPPTEIIPPTPAPAEVIPAVKSDPIIFQKGGSGPRIDPAGPQSNARSFSAGNLRHAIGRDGVGAAPIIFHGGGVPTERIQPYPGHFVSPGREVDPAGSIGRDIKEALAAQEAAGQFSASSSGRIVQKIFNPEFLVKHDIRMSELPNLKGNMRLLLEGKNIRATDDLPGITQKEFHEAMDVTHTGGHWGADIKSESQWNAVIKKLMQRADGHLNHTPSHSPIVVGGGRLESTGAPKDLPVSGAPVEIPEPSVDESIGSILKNNTLTEGARFREVSNVILHMERGHFTLHTDAGEITIAKLGSGPGAFIRLPGEESSRFWSPKTAAAIEKLLRK